MSELNSRRWVLTCGVLRTADAGVVLTLAEPRTGQVPSPQTCCAPGATMQHGSCFPYSPAPGGTAELGQRPPSDQALLLLKFFKLTRTSQSSSSAVSCCLHYFKRRTGIVSCCCQRTQPCKMMEAGPSINSLQMSLWLTHQGKNCLLFFVNFLGLPLVYPSGKFTVQLIAEKSYKVHTSTEVSTGGKLFFFHLHAQLLHRNSKV